MPKRGRDDGPFDLDEGDGGAPAPRRFRRASRKGTKRSSGGSRPGDRRKAKRARRSGGGRSRGGPRAGCTKTVAVRGYTRCAAVRRR